MSVFDKNKQIGTLAMTRVSTSATRLQLFLNNGSSLQHVSFSTKNKAYSPWDLDDAITAYQVVVFCVERPLLSAANAISTYSMLFFSFAYFSYVIV